MPTGVFPDRGRDMILLLTAYLAGATVLPQIDRRALKVESHAEATQPRANTAIAMRRPIVRRATAGNPLNLSQITTICRAAGTQADPAGFLATLSGAYSLSSQDSNALRSSCAAYLAGRADAQRAN
jgi:hypothetical protein